MRLLLTILLFFALCINFNVNAQSLPVTCTESRVRYAATPDTLFKNSIFKWFIDKGSYTDTLVYAFGDSIDVHWGQKPGIYRIGVSEVSQYGCVGDTNWSYVQINGSILNIGQDKEYCYGDSVHFDAGPGFVKYQWNNNASLTSQSFNAIAKQSDTILVTTVNQYNCPNSDTAIITVHPLPKVNITSNGVHIKDTTVCPGKSIILEAGYGGTMYNWSNGDISESVLIYGMDSVKQYTVTVSNKYENLTCSASDSVIVKPCILLPGSDDIATAFTPNGDGFNDTWEIPAMQHFPDATVDIYDRWGKIVYHCRGIYKPWDGKANGKNVPMDNYFYIIKIGKSYSVAGNITVIR